MAPFKGICHGMGEMRLEGLVALLNWLMPLVAASKSVN
jgi:hypothetical protein